MQTGDDLDRDRASLCLCVICMYYMYILELRKAIFCHCMASIAEKSIL